MLAALKVIHGKNWKRRGVLEHFLYQIVLELFKPFWQITQRVARASSMSSILFGFSVSAGPRDELPRTSSLILSLLVAAGCSVEVSVSCDEDVGEVGEDELEELVDRPGTTNGT